MESENSLSRIALFVVIVSIIIAGLVTIQYRQSEPAKSVPVAISNDLSAGGEEFHEILTRMRVLWYDDKTRTYTFQDYENNTITDPDSFEIIAIPEPEPGSIRQQAGMVRFLTWDGSVERMIGTRYLIDQDEITNILNRYTLVATSDNQQIATIPTPTPTLPRDTAIYPLPSRDGMLIPLGGTTCSRSDGWHTTTFGYINRYDHPVSVPIGKDNEFLPGNLDLGQPVHFEPGIHHDVFSITYPNNVTNQIWNLLDVQVSAGMAPPLYASFTAEPLFGYAPLEILFTDHSSGGTPENPLITSWDLGDGTSGTGNVIRHRYENPGEYQVTRMIDNRCGSMTASHIINVYQADFTWSSQPDNPEIISFKDLSGGEPSVNFWNFADQYTSWEKNPVHTFKNPGTYRVELTVSGSAGTGSVVHEIIIP